MPKTPLQFSCNVAAMFLSAAPSVCYDSAEHSRYGMFYFTNPQEVAILERIGL